MIWLALLGLVSLAFILVGGNLAVKRIRSFSQEAETRRLRAFAQMVEIEKKQGEGRGAQGAEKEDVESRM